MTRVPRLLAISSPDVPLEALCAHARSLAELGPEVALLYRHPGLADRTYLENARALVRCGVALFVHGRVDVALVLGAHLHLPVNAPSARELRALFPSPRFISAAVHDASELSVRAPGADFILVSPVFVPGSKPDDTRPPLGSEGFRALAQASSAPAFALGGMTPERTAALSPAPAGVAAIGALWSGPSPAQVAQAFLEALGPGP